MRGRRTARALLTLGVFVAGLLAGLGLARDPVPAEASSSRARVEAHFSPNGGVEDALMRAIEGARQELLVGVYLFTSRRLAGAVQRAHHRGVEVRVLLDAEQDESMPQAKGKDLAEAGVNVRFVDLGLNERRRPIRYHNKIAIIDGTTVITGSYNWTVQADQDNHENIVAIHSRGLAELFRRDFAATWQQVAGD